jgi:hypothetical protein
MGLRSLLQFSYSAIAAAIVQISFHPNFEPKSAADEKDHFSAKLHRYGYYMHN